MKRGKEVLLYVFFKIKNIEAESGLLNIRSVNLVGDCAQTFKCKWPNLRNISI